MNDFSYWEECYLEYAKLNVFKKRIEKSKQIIDEFLGLYSNSYISWSGGKDSTCLLHLIISKYPNIRVMTEKDDMDFPNEMDYILNIKEKYNINLDIVSPKESILDNIEKYDIFENVHSRDSDFSQRYFYNLISEYKNKNNYNGVFLGLRKEESNSRQYNYNNNGYYYYNRRDNDYVCQPIVNFKSEDVFAYLLKNDIPILDVYKKIKFVEKPGDIRKSWYLPSNFAHRGYVSWLKHYYPKLFDILLNKFPNIKSYI